MKTTLPERSLVIKERLEKITQEILAAGKKEIAMIILFGSYARGDWVSDSYQEGHITYSYESDIDILVLTKSPKYAGYQGISLRRKIEKRLDKKDLRPDRSFFTPATTLIIETIQHVNKEIEKSRYFFSDIKKEGVLLYDSGEAKLAEPRDLSWEERREIAKDDFEQWFGSGSEFLILANFSMNKNLLNKAAFLLHQATESFYNAILLVFSGYKGKIHDIKELGSLASNYSNELLKIFPRDTAEQEKCFILLKEAYTEARYNKNYKITEEQLLYLISRVEKLKSVTEEICQAWINKTSVK